MNVSLQFHGVSNAELVAGLGLALALAMVVYGIWQLVAHRRPRRAAVSGALGIASVVAVAWAVGKAPLTSAGHGLLWMILLACVVGAAISVFYAAVYAYLGRRRMAALLVLRFLAVLSLLLVLFKPAVSVQPSAQDARLVLPILVDRSGSMDVADQPNMPKRYRQAVESLWGQRDRINRNFRPAWIHFAAKPQSVDSLDELSGLSPTGEGTDATDIVAALREAASGARADELAGIILISDGIHNGPGNLLDAGRESPAPIYAFGVGAQNESATGQGNVRLLSVDGPLEAIKNNITTVVAKVKLTGWANIATRVILSENGKEMDSQPVLTDSANFTATVQLKWTPGEPPAGATGPDIRKLTVTAQPNPAESTAEDNAADLHVLVTNPGVRVLYVEGTLRPEYKYLRRVLAADPNVRVMSLARISANKFLAQGGIDGKTLTDLPRTDEDFRLFDVIILGDLDRTFLTNDQMERIRKFVDDGKSLLMIGGRNSFGPGGYGDTPIEAALPVVVGPRTQPQETGPFLPQLTAEGLVSPIFAGLEKQFNTPAGKAADPLPDLLGCVGVVKAKPGAQVLAIHPTRKNADGPLVVLATHQYGAGRAAAFTGDTTWQWYLRPRLTGADSPYHIFWGQLIRYLAGVENKQQASASTVMARTDRSFVQQGEDVKITALVKNAAGQPDNEATVSLAVKFDGEDKQTQFALAKVTAGAGIYEVSYRPTHSGHAALTVAAQDKLGKPLGTDQLPLTVGGYSRETARLARDVAALKSLSGQRGGKYLELSALPEVIDDLIQAQASRLAPQPPVHQYNLHSLPILFAIFAGLVTVEWLLRRNWQLH